MSLRSRYVRGNLVYYDTHRMRVVDAIGPTVVKWILDAADFQPKGGTGTDPRGYTTTVVETGTATSEAEASDLATITAEFITDNAENDGIGIQLNGEAFRPTKRDLYFGISIDINDVTQTDFIVGLSITDTTLLGGMTDGIYFRKVDGSASVSAVTEKDSIETETTGVNTMTDDTEVTLEFYFDGSSVYFFVNGVQQAIHTANIPDDEALTPSIEFLTGEAVANRLRVRWARAFSIG